MIMASWQRQGVSDEQWELLLEQERLKGLVADELAQALQQAGLSKTSFAKLLGVSPARISQILSGVENLTLESLATVSRPLGLSWNIRLARKDFWSQEPLEGFLRSRTRHSAGWPGSSEEAEQELFSVLGGAAGGRPTRRTRNVRGRLSTKRWEKVAS